MLNKEDQLWCEETAKKIAQKMAWVSRKSAKKIPYTTIDGTHDDKTDMSVDWDAENGINWWTNGFWGGMLWQMYLQTGAEEYAEIAEFSEDVLDQCLRDYYGLHHDVGFMWLLTSVAHYRIKGDQHARRRGLHAASLLAGRFNPKGKFIRAWNEFQGGGRDTRGWAIIDCLMNLPLLYWASKETEDPRFRYIAEIHADTVMKNFVREDGSVEHIVQFDLESGAKVKAYGGQGYADGSAWTRGQAWGIYGFIISYIHTQRAEYLATAKKIADYFILHIPENHLIPIDFCQPKDPAWEDSTAAVIAASGMIEIARYTKEQKYLDAALALLKTLTEKRCNWSEACDCILERCSAAYHDKEHEFSIIYGDYFFMEAIFKLKGNEVFFW